jgi:hypothetical protein
MDFAFVPGIGDIAIDNNLAAMKLRPNTMVFSDPAGLTVQQFLRIASLAVVAFPPPGDLLMSSHGTSEGEIYLGLDANTPGPATFEKLVNARASGSIKIPPALNPANANVRLSGCQLGTDDVRPVLQMFKEALGNPNSVTAHKFLHVMASPDGQEYWESLLYDFTVLGKDSGKQPFASRDEVVAAFVGAHHKFFDDTDVPAGNWAKWVPLPPAPLGLNTSNVFQTTFAFPMTAEIPAGVTSTVHASGTWLSEVEPVTFTVDTIVQPVGLGAILATLEEELPKQFAFNQHTYPVYKRYHFNTLADFINGWNWQVTLNGNALAFVGTRYKYHLWIPVTKPGTDQFILNRFPPSGNPTITFAPATQPKLFGVV